MRQVGEILQLKKGSAPVIFHLNDDSGLYFHWEEEKKLGDCGMHLASVRPDLGWTSYLDPWGSSFPSAGRVMLSLQSATPRSTQPAEDFCSYDLRACFAFPTEWFSKIFSTAVVLIGGARWGRILLTFANVSTNVVSQSHEAEKLWCFMKQKIKRNIEISGVFVFLLTLSVLETLGCFHTVHLREIQNGQHWKSLQLTHLYSNNHYNWRRSYWYLQDNFIVFLL